MKTALIASGKLPDPVNGLLAPVARRYGASMSETGKPLKDVSYAHDERPNLPYYSDTCACALCGADGHVAADCHLRLLLSDEAPVLIEDGVIGLAA